MSTEKQERSATPSLGAERKIGSHSHSRSSAGRIAGSVTVDPISGRWTPAIRVPIALFAPNRFIIGPPAREALRQAAAGIPSVVFAHREARSRAPNKPLNIDQTGCAPKRIGTA
ncbi:MULTISPECIES: hypothetical protein [unclassified Burkholderia]|uniref:hypothetical protein n=1 Tax=unclassified Burkholderia TaxID=2613784 RepID=UPI001D0F4E3E|nr:MULTISPECIES: hypothetical protein [unclassified Burkholderia]